MIEKDFMQTILGSTQSVFSFCDIAMLLEDSDADNLKRRISYYVQKGVLIRLRKGLYAKPIYNKEEIAGKIFVPSYISGEYVLRKNGIIFQYGDEITVVSYLSRTVSVADFDIVIRKIKDSVLVDTSGIEKSAQGVSIASSERALLDVLYLNKDFFFDNISSINKASVYRLAKIYRSKVLIKRVKKVFGDD